jgi:hypothetical protein
MSMPVPVDVEGQGQEKQDEEPESEPATSHDNELVKVPSVLRHIARANEAEGEMHLQL